MYLPEKLLPKVVGKLEFVLGMYLTFVLAGMMITFAETVSESHTSPRYTCTRRARAASDSGHDNQFTGIKLYYDKLLFAIFCHLLKFELDHKTKKIKCQYSLIKLKDIYSNRSFLQLNSK